MDERVIQFRVGAVVVAAVAIAVLLIMLLGAGPRLFRDQYIVYIGFPEAPGVTVDSPVRKSGVLIGRVSGVQLLDEGGVVLSLRIDQRYRLRHNEICRIGTGSLVTGDAVLEFVPSGDPAASRELIEDGEYLANGVVAGDPLQVFVDLEDRMSAAIVSVESAGSEVALMASGLRSVVGTNEDQLRRIMQKSETALDRFHVTMTSIDEVVRDPEVEQLLRNAMRDVPELVQEARVTLAQARETFRQFQQVGERAERNLENLQDLTGPLGDRGEQLARTLDETTGHMNVLIQQLALVARSVNQRDGALGKLIHEDDVYHDLRQAAVNIEDVTKRLIPILNDVRVFTDKIATDPRVLGVRGALDARPLGSGLKHDVSR